MSDRKQLVETSLGGFRRSDHTMVLACLTDDVVWDLPGFKHLEGKDAFDGEIESPDFTGSPALVVDRLVEESDTVVAIATGRGNHREAGPFAFAYCDVFTFRDDLISRVESYVLALGGPCARRSDRGVASTATAPAAPGSSSPATSAARCSSRRSSWAASASSSTPPTSPTSAR